MAAEDVYVKGVRQIIPSQGLWLRYDESRENLGERFMPVVAIDGRTVGAGKPGPMSRRLRELYLHMAGVPAAAA